MKRGIGVMLVPALILSLLVNPTFAGTRYFTFGENAVDPTRSLHPGECVIAIDADSPFAITVKGRRAGTNEFATDTAYVHSGEKIVVSADGTALYVARCGNDILAPRDWKPQGTTVRCESRVAAIQPAEAATTKIYVYGDERPAPPPRDEVRKRRVWPWVVGGILLGALIASRNHEDEVNVTVTNENSNCRNRCK